MKRTITLIALAVLGFQFANATNGSEMNTKTHQLEEAINDNTEGRIYYWEVENAHGSASGFVTSMEKAEEMINKVSKGDVNRVTIVKSNPIK